MTAGDYCCCWRKMGLLQRWTAGCCCLVVVRLSVWGLRCPPAACVVAALSLWPREQCTCAGAWTAADWVQAGVWLRFGVCWLPACSLRVTFCVWFAAAVVVGDQGEQTANGEERKTPDAATMSQQRYQQ